MAFLLSILLCLTIVIAKRMHTGREEIECDGFKTQQCLDLVYEYYGLTESELSAYGSMQQAILADSIECHYIYDVCPFYVPPITGEKKNCIDGRIEFIEDSDSGDINYYECRDVNLFSFLPIEHLGSNNNASGADIWGYQTVDIDGNVNKHYAITGQADGSSIVDVTDPINPNVLAFIISNVNESLFRNVLWRDIKVYKEWAIVVVDTGGVDDHGIQIYNIRDAIENASSFQEEFGSDDDIRKPIYNVSKDDVIVYEDVGRCHNVYVDNEIGHLYAFGSMGKNERNDCSTGIHIIDINDPSQPEFRGCYDDALYVHDAQCVKYHGPDEDYQGHEICFMFTPSVGNLTIIDITNPTDVKHVSSTTYFTPSYTHQGWVTSNHEYLLLDDETDEGPLPERFPVTQNLTTTYIFDITDLDNVDYRRAHRSHVRAVDHNQYIVDNGHRYRSNHDKFRGYTFQSNYEAGLRVLSIDNIANENGNQLEEVAFFDVYPWKTNSSGLPVFDNIKFFGAWSTYPYFNKLGTNPNDHIYSNKLIVHSTTTGLYVVEFMGDMDFSTQDVQPDDDQGFLFEWDAWYGITVSVVIAVLGVLTLALVLYKLCTRSRKNKRMGVYENIVGMEKPSKYGNQGATGVSTGVSTGPSQRL